MSRPRDNKAEYLLLYAADQYHLHKWRINYFSPDGADYAETIKAEGRSHNYKMTYVAFPASPVRHHHVGSFMGEPVITCSEEGLREGRFCTSLWMQHTCTKTRTNSVIATTMPTTHIPTLNTQKTHSSDAYTAKNVDSSFYIRCQI